MSQYLYTDCGHQDCISQCYTQLEPHDPTFCWKLAFAIGIEALSCQMAVSNANIRLDN